MQLTEETKFRYVINSKIDMKLPDGKLRIKKGDNYFMDMTIKEVEKFFERGMNLNVVSRHVQLPFVDTDRKPLFIGDKLKFIKDRKPESDIGDIFTIVHSSDNTTCGAIVKMEYSDDENKVEYVRLDKLTSFNLNIYKLSNFRVIGSTLGTELFNSDRIDL